MKLKIERKGIEDEEFGFVYYRIMEFVLLFIFVLCLFGRLVMFKWFFYE